jgi:hypothetical protein
VRESFSHDLAQPPFHLIAYDRSTDAPAHREANSHRRLNAFHESFGSRIADDQKPPMRCATALPHALEIATRSQAVCSTPARSLRFTWWYTSGLVLLFHGFRAFTAPQRSIWTNRMRLVCRVGNADGDETHSKVIAVDHTVA